MLSTLKGVYMIESWKLLKRSFYTTAEFWKTPTKWLVCKRQERYYKFFDTEEEANDCYNTVKEE